MKKIVATAALTLATFGFAMSAQAAYENMFDPAGSYRTDFTGTEYTHMFASQGGALIDSPVNPDGTLKTGFEMSGVFAMTTAQRGEFGNEMFGDTIFPDYANGGLGTYVAVLTGLVADTTEGTTVGGATASISFAGGQIALYYIADMTPNNIIGKVGWGNGGLTLNNATFDPSTWELVDTFDLIGSNGTTGMATVHIQEGAVLAQTTMFGMSNSGYLASGMYGNENGSNLNADLQLTADLVWKAQGDKFDVTGQGYMTRSAVPEPTTMLLFGAGLVGLAAVGRRRNAK